MKSILKTIGLLISIFIVPFCVHANLIDIEYGAGAGSFELQSGAYVEYLEGGDFMRLPSGSTQIVGWTIGGNGIDYLREPKHLAYGAGQYSVDLAAQTPGTLSTTFSTVTGNQYLLEFYAYGSSSGGDFSGLVSAGTLNNQLFTPANYFSPSSASYTAYNYLFSATSSTTTLFFDVASSPTGFGPVIDNISVTAAVVPLPPTLLLLFSGILSLGFFRKKKADIISCV